MISHFEDAIADAKACPWMWSIHDADDALARRVHDDQRRHPGRGPPRGRRLTSVGPYFLWRLLIDHLATRAGARPGRAIDAIADYIRTRPAGTSLLVSAAPGEGSPQPFYLHYGFEKTGEVKMGEELMRLDLVAQGADAIGGW